MITVSAASYRITLGQHKSDNNNRMIQLTDVFCVLLRYNETSNIWLQNAADAINRDPIKRRALYCNESRLMESPANVISR